MWANNVHQEQIHKLYPILHNSQRKNEVAKESQILLWIFNIFQQIHCDEYERYIRDGVILCSNKYINYPHAYRYFRKVLIDLRLMNIIKPGSIEESEIRPGITLNDKRINISLFLKAAKNYGVSEDKLFTVNDLLLLENIPRVTQCIFCLGYLADNDANYTGVQLGPLPFEPSDPLTKRRHGLPEGDDLLISHVNIERLKQKIMSS